MHIETLTTLQYSDDRRGTLGVYFYFSDGTHTPPVWFRRGPPRSGDTTLALVKAWVEQWRLLNGEVRIVNPGDLLIFHAKDGKVIHPASAEEFWKSLQ